MHKYLTIHPSFPPSMREFEIFRDDSTHKLLPFPISIPNFAAKAHDICSNVSPDSYFFVVFILYSYMFHIFSFSNFLLFNHFPNRRIQKAKTFFKIWELLSLLLWGVSKLSLSTGTSKIDFRQCLNLKCKMDIHKSFKPGARYVA